MLLSNNSELDEFVKSWLSEMVNRCIFSFEINGMYPIIYETYEKLIEHRNKDKTDKIYKNKVTEASILYPLLTVFCSLYKLDSLSKDLEEFATENWHIARYSIGIQINTVNNICTRTQIHMAQRQQISR